MSSGYQHLFLAQILKLVGFLEPHEDSLAKLHAYYLVNSSLNADITSQSQITDTANQTALIYRPEPRGVQCPWFTAGKDLSHTDPAPQ